jgi:hypothetical protein
MRRREISRCRERDSWLRSSRSRSSLGVTGTSRNHALPGEGEGVGKRPSGQVAGTDQRGDNEWLKEAVSVRVGEGEEVVRNEEATERDRERALRYRERGAGGCCSPGCAC